MSPDVGSLEWYDIALRMVAAAVLGGLIGLEREVDGHDAGFRTHMLLAVGSALFGAISVGAFDEFVDRRSATNVNVDITRTAAYVAAGVGFIGGGAILKSFGVVRGITTAASLWTTAAVGVAVGLGFWSGAIATTVIALVALAALRPVDSLVGRVANKDRSVLIQGRKDADLAAIIQELQTVVGGSFKQIRIGAGEDQDSLEVVIELWAEPDTSTADRMFERLASRDDVTSVRVYRAPRRGPDG